MPAKPIHSYLSVLRPSLDVPDAEKFKYPELQAIVKRDLQEQYDTIDEIFDRYDADDEGAVDLRLSHEYLLMTALKLQEASSDRERRLWSRRYTDVSIEIFGRPWVDQAAIIAADELVRLKGMGDSAASKPDSYDKLIETYTKLAQLAPTDESVPSHESLHDSIRAYLESNYRDAFEVIDGNDEDILTVGKIRDLFEHALRTLGWEEWQVRFDDTAQMSVSSQRKSINIGAYTPPITRRRVRGLFTHEVLTHAQRAVRGAEYDQNLSYGLPGYLTAEEGLAVLMETSIGGRLPDRISDRYIDITLALGTALTQPMSRFELFQLTMARNLLRQEGSPQKVDRSIVRRLAWQHVNRIYRGTLGNEFVGVLTKDTAYYRGYQEMAQYLKRYEGEYLDRALNFVLSGKFDPTKPLHRLYVHSRRFDAEYDLENLRE